MAFIVVVVHVAGMLGADVRHGVRWREEVEKREAVAVAGSGSVAPCYAVSEGEDAERDDVLDTNILD
jgi:hypothetical protein